MVLAGDGWRSRTHVLDPKLTESEFVVQQDSTGNSARVRKIEYWDFKPEDIDRFQGLSWDFVKRIVTRPRSYAVGVGMGSSISAIDPSRKL